ncbi:MULTISPECIES: FG-GAP and VCBS repeat-containing protein [unclassified Streptomyces]|uniref:FG-GAP-like repeat-containing protein n=1 Tax=Streptomyces sp. NBC_00119 TaxID=2975659 RepID=A0AAU1UB92_9ACTN|nr:MULTISPECIES: FG-GAP and VCBS repeat-containing protein [unclassified Streptomyces]MCX4644222.1 FG-GAP-like repeat-containing protein [Streptomyces sp. NBC_01446]MCX5325334.1 FG-GAP-like repeat-containing protein [Streptomyces sp. NBC_00120]
MHKHIRIALASAAAVALTGGLLSLSTGSALAADSVHHHEADFNGDHIGDVAFSAGWSTVGGKKGAGQFVALYGSANGLNAATRKTVSQNTTGVPGTAETNDGFGWVSAYGDFNDDGYDDLAVSARYEDVDGDTDGGTVMIMWGSASGLTGGTTIADPAVSSHDQWGKTLAAGDFDGDGKDDLAVGSSTATIYVYKGGIAKTGTAGGRYTLKPPIQSGSGTGPLTLTAGDVNGDGATDLVVDGFETNTSDGWNTNYYIPGSASGLVVSSAQTLKPGVITDIGDVNGDGFGDIVTGQQWDKPTDGSPDPTGSTDGGKVNITYGSTSGPATTTAISQNTGNVPGDSERGDDFGGELSLGDVNGDNYQDLVVGAAGENLGGVTDTGSVTVLYGSASGINTQSGGQFFAQSTAGVPGSDETKDYFGNEVKLTDVTGDGKADLTIGAYGENSGNGALTYLPSNGTKITTTGARSFSATSLAISTDAYPQLGGNAAN